MVESVVFPFILAQCCPFLVSPISGPGHIPKDPHLSLRGIHAVLPYLRSRVYAPRPSLSLSVPHRVLLSDLMPGPDAGTECLLLSGFSFGLGAFGLPLMLLHVFANLFAVQVHSLCDVMASYICRYFHFDFAD